MSRMQKLFVLVSTALLCATTLPLDAVAAPPKVMTYPAKFEHVATIKLLSADDKTGRKNPIYDNYRPQLVFSGEKEGILCEIHLIKPQEMVEPGEISEVKLSCLEKFKVIQDKLEFTGFEGGRLVITGSLK